VSQLIHCEQCPFSSLPFITPPELGLRYLWQAVLAAYVYRRAAARRVKLIQSG
jgi:hypothetical protein